MDSRSKKTEGILKAIDQKLEAIVADDAAYLKEKEEYEKLFESAKKEVKAMSSTQRGELSESFDGKREHFGFFEEGESRRGGRR
jgi:2',3'-cyclic-nucleotide 2'-phosphodiesterase (5'-nucleotidase family)